MLALSAGAWQYPPFERRRKFVTDSDLMKKICLALLAWFVCSGAGHALDREQRHGKALLEEFCARCHAMGRQGRSPHADALQFRAFGQNQLYDDDF
jgi:mono/diheme cytochrome c family protein